jgi:hypothetical protein
MQIQFVPAQHTAIQHSRPALTAPVLPTQASKRDAQVRFGFFQLKPMELLIAGGYIGLKSAARLLNIVTLGKLGLKKGEDFKFNIM